MKYSKTRNSEPAITFLGVQNINGPPITTLEYPQNFGTTNKFRNVAENAKILEEKVIFQKRGKISHPLKKGLFHR